MDDLSHDADGDFFGRLGANLHPYRCVYPGEFSVGYPLFAKCFSRHQPAPLAAYDANIGSLPAQ